MFNGYFDAQGACLFGMTGKKIRQYPAYTGLTSLGMCVRNDVVDRQTRAFMKAIGYRGIYDSCDGQYKVLDVNPRIGATFRLFAADNGMDVIRALYLDLTGQPVEPGATPAGRKWLVGDCDLVSSIRYLRDGKLTLKEWFLSHRGVRETGLFAIDDPLPALWMGIRDLTEALSRKIARAA
jgi:D-aspartate ligase